MNAIRTAPRCVQCNNECPNGIMKFPELIVCQNPECPNYGLFQMWKDWMDKVNELFPYMSNNIEGH